MNTVELIREIVNNNLKNSDYFIVDLEISKDDKNIFIYLDGDNGIDINTCAKLSRNISEEIETKDILKSAYILQVSSPGIERPLRFKRQYKKNIGRNLNVVLKDGSIVQGKLIFLDDEQIILKLNKKEKDLTERTIEFSNIEKTNVLI